jgi:hypothetical protein
MNRIWSWLRGRDLWPDEWDYVTVADAFDHSTITNFGPGDELTISSSFGIQRCRIWWVDMERQVLTIAPPL